MAKLKIIFFSDSHLGHDYPIHSRTDRHRRGEDFFRNHNFCLKYAVEKKADLVLHGGDYFFRTKIPEQIVARAYDELLNFAMNGIPIVIVPGNHESSRLPGSLLTQHKNINIFDDAGSFHFEFNGIKINIYGFPYHKKNIRDSFPDIRNQIISKNKPADINLLMVHHAVEGCTCGPGNYTFRHNEDVIQMKDITEDFNAVLCGHIHRNQILYKKINADKSIPVIYPGSVERTSFAEKNETKGFYYMEWAIEETKLSKLEFIPLQARPMQDFLIPEDNFSIRQLQENFMSFINSIDENSIVRIKLTDRKILSAINTKFIKENVPETINIEYSGFSKLRK